MARERGQKKSFQQSLEDIKEKMKEKRNKRLASASAPNRGRSKIMNKTSGGNTKHILNGVQLNNKALAVALQAEKEKVRQANGVILQLKREQQALFLHLLLLKRKLKEQVALASAPESEPTKIFAEPQKHVDSPRRMQISQSLDKPITCEAPTICTDLQAPEKVGRPEFDTHVTLPPTVGVRRRHAERNSRRRSERVQEQRSFSEGNPIAPLEAVVGDVLEGLGALTASPIHSDSDNQNQKRQKVEPEPTDPIGAEEFQHSTPEPVPAKSTNQQQPRRKQAQQQPRPKPEPAARKHERGRKPERAPLKKPWENPKPRTRSKSRDRSATRARTAPPPQGDKLNKSLGFNDTFDFDCEEAVHLTPFRSKADDSQPAMPRCEEALERGQTPMQSPPVVSKKTESSLSSPSSESEDSLYVPQRAQRRQSPPDRTKAIPTRRRRPSKVVRQKENIPLQQEMPVFRDEALHPEKEKLLLPANSPEPMMEMEQENPLEPCREEVGEDCLLPVTPGVEAEMIRIDNVLSSFGDSSTETPPLLPSKMPKKANTCKKRGLGVRTAGRGLSLCDVTNLSPTAYCKFSCGSSRPSDARCATPVPARKRRCTMTVDYKEPSLNGKLRRGDKFTDVQFLRSPIFKQKPGRTSVQNSRKSLKSQQPFEKYNESFVGCR